MSFNKLESFSNKDVIREEVSILTDLLTDVTRKILSPETFEKIEMMQDLAVHSKYQELKGIVEELTTEEMVYISRYFSILPLLINISEDVDLAYEINHQNNIDQDYLGKLSTTTSLPPFLALLQLPFTSPFRLSQKHNQNFLHAHRPHFTMC